MVKRALLAFSFLAALGVVGVGSKAMAWNDCGGRPYVAAYQYPPYGTYATYGAGWGPQVAYYPAAVPVVRTYPVVYGRDYDRHHHHHHDGVRISFGF